MRALLVLGIAMAIAASAFGADDAEIVRQHFNSENYTVTWRAVPTFDSDAELEIGYGAGHSFRLGWMWFRPAEDRVDILSVQLDGRREPYPSKWPPDRTPVSIQHAQMSRDDYAVLLRDLAMIDAAELHPVRRKSATKQSALLSSNNFWVFARLAANDETLIDFNWSGYEGSRAEVDFAKPQAAVARARAAVAGLNFKDHTLSGKERRWASAKFVRDWRTFKDLEFHWWVRERYIVIIGIAGDASVLPALQKVLEGDPKDRCVYYAVNAITRLTNKGRARQTSGRNGCRSRAKTDH